MNHPKCAPHPLLKDPWSICVSHRTRQIKAASILTAWVSVLFLLQSIIQTGRPADSDPIVQVTGQPLAVCVESVN